MSDHEIKPGENLEEENQEQEVGIRDAEGYQTTADFLQTK
ncbi:hypothetical protein GCM10011571_19740 [Marinithermofilum abyssi]|uniref:Uncharacterized protein n=1 Tax=Marinithermofilum abyssi TaxID=1571185 RepID=A0A8J2VGQ0_9BACL|nr:hypothetical protein GCM10011571_19740 [Marinithermofilum abyssi]